MPFKEGNNLGKGRPKGASNKRTETIKQTIAEIVAAFSKDDLIKDLHEMSPSRRVAALQDYCKYLIPSMKEVELDTRSSQEELNEAYIQKLMEIPEENFNKHHEGD
jgi:hypothetical protein